MLYKQVKQNHYIYDAKTPLFLIHLLRRYFSYFQSPKRTLWWEDFEYSHFNTLGPDEHTWPWQGFFTLRWRHNGRDSVLDHQPKDCLLNRYLDADQRKHQSSASLAFVWGIHRGPVNSPHKWPVARKMFPFDDVIMKCIQLCYRMRPSYFSSISLYSLPCGW